MVKAPFLVLLSLVILFYAASAATVQTPTSTSIKEKNATLDITPINIQAIILRGGILISYFDAASTIGNLPLNFSVIAIGDLENQVNFTSGSFFTLQPAGSARVNFTIVVPSDLAPDTYGLTFVINDTNGATKFVNATIIVTEPALLPPSPHAGGGGNELIISTDVLKGPPLFDIIIDVINATMTEGEFLTMLVNITNFGISTNKIDVEITYSILDAKGNVIYTKTETRAIGAGLTYEKSFPGAKLPPGKYSINTIVVYGDNQKAVAINIFVVNKPGGINLEQFPQISAFTMNSTMIEILLTIMLVWILYQRVKEKQHMRRYH